MRMTQENVSLPRAELCLQRSASAATPWQTSKWPDYRQRHALTQKQEICVLGHQLLLKLKKLRATVEEAAARNITLLRSASWNAIVQGPAHSTSISSKSCIWRISMPQCSSTHPCRLPHLLITLGDIPVSDLPQHAQIGAGFRDIKDIASHAGIRMTLHSDITTSLASPHEAVLRSSVARLEALHQVSIDGLVAHR